eukprot:1152383-Pelagomonas_calceolata.AAC.1
MEALGQKDQASSGGRMPLWTPFYSYIAERVDLHHIIFGFLRTPPATLQMGTYGHMASRVSRMHTFIAFC